MNAHIKPNEILCVGPLCPIPKVISISGTKENTPTRPAKIGNSSNDITLSETNANATNEPSKNPKPICPSLNTFIHLPMTLS